MDLKNPILDDRQVAYINGLIAEENNSFYKKQFLELYELDGIGHFIKNIHEWVTNIFFTLSRYK
jgi:hypothetical protein